MERAHHIYRVHGRNSDSTALSTPRCLEVGGQQGQEQVENQLQVEGVGVWVAIKITAVRKKGLGVRSL